MSKIYEKTVNLLRDSRKWFFIAPYKVGNLFYKNIYQFPKEVRIIPEHGRVKTYIIKSHEELSKFYQIQEKDLREHRRPKREVYVGLGIRKSKEEKPKTYGHTYLDFDTDDPEKLEDVLREAMMVQAWLEDHDLKGLLAFSGSKGFHLIIPFNEPVEMDLKTFPKTLKKMIKSEKKVKLRYLDTNEGKQAVTNVERMLFSYNSKARGRNIHQGRMIPLGYEIHDLKRMIEYIEGSCIGDPPIVEKEAFQSTDDVDYRDKFKYNHKVVGKFTRGSLFNFQIGRQGQKTRKVERDELTGFDRLTGLRGLAYKMLRVTREANMSYKVMSCGRLGPCLKIQCVRRSHPDTDPSMYIYENAFKCFGCDTKGNAQKLANLILKEGKEEYRRVFKRLYPNGWWKPKNRKRGGEKN